MSARADIFVDYLSVEPVNRDQTVYLVEQAKGPDRNWSDFSKACGVNPSVFSRLINGKNTGVLSDMLLARIALNAVRESGVTIELLLAAQGRRPHQNARPASSSLMDFAREDMAASINSGVASANPVTATQGVFNGENLDINQYNRLVAYANMMSGTYYQARQIQQIIQDAILQQGFTVKLDKDKTAISGLKDDVDQMAEFVFITNALEEEGLDRWAFMGLIGTPDASCYSVVQNLGFMYLNNPLDRGTRVTFFTGNLQTYTQLYNKLHDKKIYASVSVVLVDAVKREVLNEFVLPRHDTDVQAKIFTGPDSFPTRFYLEQQEQDEQQNEGEDTE